MSRGIPVADISPTLNDAVKKLRAGSESVGNGKPRWMRFDDTRPHERHKLGEALSRESLNDMFTKATQDPNKSGTVGDLILCATQIDILQCVERSLRFRHTSGIRAAMHAAARRAGHGSEDGALATCIIGAITGLAKTNKQAGGA
jgi:hypothetical protein